MPVRLDRPTQRSVHALVFLCECPSCCSSSQAFRQGLLVSYATLYFAEAERKGGQSLRSSFDGISVRLLKNAVIRYEIFFA